MKLKELLELIDGQVVVREKIFDQSLYAYPIVAQGKAADLLEKSSGYYSYNVLKIKPVKSLYGYAYLNIKIEKADEEKAGTSTQDRMIRARELLALIDEDSYVQLESEYYDPNLKTCFYPPVSMGKVDGIIKSCNKFSFSDNYLNHKLVGLDMQIDLYGTPGLNVKTREHFRDL